MPDNDLEVKKIQAVYAVQIPAEGAIIIKYCSAGTRHFFSVEENSCVDFRKKRVLQAKNRTLQPPDVNSNITISEIKEAEIAILQCVQKESFAALYH